MTEIDNNFKDFFLRTAQTWQFNRDYNFLKNINLSQQQKDIIDKTEIYMLINGSAGSGKSITLLYKMIKAMMEETERQKILFITFNSTLASDTYKRACNIKEFNEYRSYHKVRIWTFHQVAYEILNNLGFKEIEYVNVTINEIQRKNDHIYRRLYPVWEEYTDTGNSVYKNLNEKERLYSTHDVKFLREEIRWMKANGYINKEDYLNVSRVGRGNAPRLTKIQRNTIYSMFLKYEKLKRSRYNDAMDLEDYALEILKNFNLIPKDMYFDHIFIDEVQDLQAMQIKVLRMLAKKSLTIAGDSKQKIYDLSPYSYSNLGINITSGKNRTLTRTFRSTKEIAKLANSLEFTDIQKDKITDVELMSQGDKPEIRYYATKESEVRFIIKKVKEIHNKDKGSTIAVIHREEKKLYKREESFLRTSLEESFKLVDVESYRKKFKYNEKKKPIFYTDIYSVKGLEFDYIFIVDFKKGFYPDSKKFTELYKYYKNQSAAQNDSYDQDVNDIINEEKRLLYVAITRAKKKVFFTYSGQNERVVSTFIKDFDTKDYEVYGFRKTKLKGRDVSEEELLAILST